MLVAHCDFCRGLRNWPEAALIDSAGVCHLCGSCEPVYILSRAVLHGLKPARSAWCFAGPCNAPV